MNVGHGKLSEFVKTGEREAFLLINIKKSFSMKPY
jgi:hypothetical protein